MWGIVELGSFIYSSHVCKDSDRENSHPGAFRVFLLFIDTDLSKLHYYLGWKNRTLIFFDLVGRRAARGFSYMKGQLVQRFTVNHLSLFSSTTLTTMINLICMTKFVTALQKRITN